MCILNGNFVLITIIDNAFLLFIILDTLYHIFCYKKYTNIIY